MSSHELVNIENSRTEKRTVAAPRLSVVCEGSPPSVLHLREMPHLTRASLRETSVFISVQISFQQE